MWGDARSSECFYYVSKFFFFFVFGGAGEGGVDRG